MTDLNNYCLSCVNFAQKEGHTFCDHPEPFDKSFAEHVNMLDECIKYEQGIHKSFIL